MQHKPMEASFYTLDRFDVHAGNKSTATSVIRLKKNDEFFEEVSLGDGPIDAAYNAIDKIANPPAHTLEHYSIRSVSEGKDTLGEVLVKLRSDRGLTMGRGLSTDIIEASVLAYLDAVNRLLAE